MRHDSTVKQFPGYVDIPDRLTYPQFFEWERARERVAVLEESDLMGRTYAFLPGILAIVSEWHIDGIPEKPTQDTFPATPIVPALGLIAWLIGIIGKIIGGVEDSPNE